jgi:hypothetical protein
MRKINGESQIGENIKFSLTVRFLLVRDGKNILIESLVLYPAGRWNISLNFFQLTDIQ